MKSLLGDSLRVSLEEQSDGKVEKEKEHVFYGRVTDFSQLLKAGAIEHQEQWEVRIPKSSKNAASGRIRVRKTIPRQDRSLGEPEYVLTTKVNNDGNSGDALSVAVPTTAEGLLVFKALAPTGMIKERFTFDAGNGLKWEVDVFYKPEVIAAKDFQIAVLSPDMTDFSMFSDWVKIDLEVEDLGAEIPQFPIALERVVSAPYGKRTPEEEQLVTSLYENIFSAKNEMRNANP